VLKKLKDEIKEKLEKERQVIQEIRDSMKTETEKRVSSSGRRPRVGDVSMCRYFSSRKYWRAI
jgi:hypothetical protein